MTNVTDAIAKIDTASNEIRAALMFDPTAQTAEDLLKLEQALNELGHFMIKTGAFLQVARENFLEQG